MTTVLNFLERYPKLVSSYIEKNMNQTISSLCSQEEPEKGGLVFVTSPESFERAVKSEVSALVIPESFKDKAPKESPVTILTSKNPRLLMALSSTELFALDKLKNQFSEQKKEDLKEKAFIHPTAKIAESALIGPGAYIGKGALIGEGVIIAANAVIQSEAEVGENSRVHEMAFVGHGCKLGKRCEIHPHAAIGIEGFGYGSDFETGAHIPINHQGYVILEDDVHVGSGTKIDRGTFGFTKICKHTKIDNLCHIAHNCEIGPYSLVTAGFKVAGSTKIGAFFVTGGNVTVTGHITICDKVNLAGLSVVHKSITEPGNYYGYPLKSLKEGLKNNAAFGNLHKMKKDLDKVMKALKLK
jgi:UDP-3-O-[3-hydroxymyristoyl] glucosamine N-acyltransferase